MDADDLFTSLASIQRQGGRYVLATVVETSGSVPQKPGAKLALTSSGALLGTIGGGAIENQVVEAAQAMLDAPGAPAARMLQTHLTRDLGMCCGGRMAVFLERFEPKAALWLFGAGHVNRAVAQAAVEVSFQVTVVDEREDWLTPERFPRAERLLEDPAIAARRIAFQPSDLVAVATHDHPLDEQVLVSLSGKSLAYVGCIGSARKAIRFRERLTQRGVPAADVDRIQMPMGAEIGAETAEEIAVSVVAELIRVRACRAVRVGRPRAVSSNPG